MALANSAVQEVNGMKTLAMATHENPNSNSVFRNPSYQLDHHHYRHNHHNHNQVSQSLINFKCGIDNLLHKNNNNESLLSFEPQGVVCDQDTFHWVDQQQRLMDDPNCSFQTATNYSPSKDNKTAAGDNDGSVYEWLYYSEPTSSVSDAIHEAEAAQEIANQKRSLMGESSGGVCKKQCTSATTKKQKPKSSAAKDPQSIAAKNRRERISERLKILQELVPNGSKVDLVTMLEKAISYVKFLQLQVKILATDDFWPVQGGKVPDISQVKEAIDAILSSQRERSSSSNSEK